MNQRSMIEIYLIHKKTNARNGKRVTKTHPLHHSLREFLIHLTLWEPPVEPQVFFCMSGWNREVPLLSCCGFQKGSASGWWFQIFFISTRIPEEMIQFDYIIFFRWVVISSPTISPKIRPPIGVMMEVVDRSSDVKSATP